LKVYSFFRFYVRHTHASAFGSISTNVDQPLSSSQSPIPYRSLTSTNFELGRRQVDPLHSCIEAKCSSWNSGNYLDCIYRHCISGFQLHGHRRDLVETSSTDTFGQPEGRFLLLPVSVNSAITAPLSDVLRPETLSRRMLLKTETNNFKRRPAVIYNGEKQEKRLKRNIRNGKHAGINYNLPQLETTIHRRYYDIEGDCIKKMCGHLEPHTLYHLQCKEQCTGNSGKA
jgi:hypothetical protein